MNIQVTSYQLAAAVLVQKIPNQQAEEKNQAVIVKVFNIFNKCHLNIHQIWKILTRLFVCIGHCKYNVKIIKLCSCVLLKTLHVGFHSTFSFIST